MVVAGLLAAAAYVAGAWISGWMSPLARRPILDGAATLPYRWVAPPPALSGSNRAPDSGRFDIGFRSDGSDPGVFATNDQQAEAILQLGAIPQVAHARAVALSIDPVDPATLGRLPDHLSVLGNAYRFRLVYRPSGSAVRSFRTPPQVVLTWPAVTNARDRSLVFSRDGRSWTILKTVADHSFLQATARPPALNGYLVVATLGSVAGFTPASGSSSPSATGSRSGGSGGGSVLPWIAIGIAVVMAGTIVIVRARSRARDREFESYRDYEEREDPRR